MMVDDIYGVTTVLLTRDDLIRLVVGMQWRELGYIYNVVRDQGDLLDDDGGVIEAVPPEVAPQIYEHFRPACDIVDEWLGVR